MEPRTPPPDDATHSEAPPLPPLDRAGPRRVGESPGDAIGPFKLLQVLGEGGFGVVWLAERREPMVQRVALKIIKPGMDSKAVIARFEQERQALAVMDHPNIAKVIDGGVTSTGRPYFVMEYVQGEPITQYCDRHRIPTRERLAIFVHVCEAVQHAHQKGLIHRDLKPSNILVTVKDSRVVPKVIDFGVAKAVSHSLTEKTIFTEVGQFIGTPEYMSPEQAEMGSTDIDTRSDVYSLGVVLYELLSGLLPFDASSLRSAGYDGIRRVIREVDPPKPSTRLTSVDAKAGTEIAKSRQQERESLTRELRRELDWIPMKALRKDRTHRYASPADLARDIKNYLDGQPLEAGPESASYRLRKLVRRNRGPVLAGSLVLLTLVLGLAGTALGFLRAEQRAEAERRAKEEAFEATKSARAATELAERAQVETARQRDSAEYEAYAANISVASSAIANYEPVRAKASLDACPQRLRGWEWGHLNAELNQNTAVLEGHVADVSRVRFSSDGSRVVTAAFDGSARIWDVESGQALGLLAGQNSVITRLAMGAAGTPADGLVATGGENGTVWVWDVMSGARVSEVIGHTGDITALAFDATLGRLLTADQQSVRVSNPRTGEAIRTIAASLRPFEECEAALIDPSGERVCTMEAKGVSRVWSVESGQQLSAFQSTAKDSGSLVGMFLPGGRVLTGFSARQFDVWNASDGSLVRTINQQSILAAVNGAGDMLLAGPYGEPSPILTDLNTGEARVRLVGHASLLLSATFNPSGKRVLTTSLDKTARIWDTSSGRELAAFFGHTGAVNHAVYSPKGDLVATASKDDTARIWNLTFRRGTVTSRHAGYEFCSSRFSPSGDRYVCRMATWEYACVCDATTGSVLLTLGQPGQRVISAAFDASGDRVITTAEAGPAQIWNAWTGELLATVGGGRKGSEAALSPSARPSQGLVALAGGPGEMALWDVASAKVTVTMSGTFDQVLVPAFSPDGTTLAGGCADGAIEVWNAATGTPIRTIKGHVGQIMALSFDAQGERLLSAGKDGTVRIWRAATGESLGVLPGHEDRVLSARFSPKGDRVVSTSGDRTVRVWDPIAARELLTIRGTGICRDAEFDPSGERLVACMDGGGVRVMESRPLAKRVAGLRAAAEAEAAMKTTLQPRLAAGELDTLVKELVGDATPDPMRRRAGLAAVAAERERRRAEAAAGRK